MPSLSNSSISNIHRSRGRVFVTAKWNPVLAGVRTNSMPEKFRNFQGNSRKLSGQSTRIAHFGAKMKHFLPSFAESHGCKPVDECEVGTLRSLGVGGYASE